MAGCGEAGGPDLGLFCFLSQVLGALSGGRTVPSSIPPGVWVALIVAALAIVVLAAWTLPRRAQTAMRRRQAERRPGAYVQCPQCRALNPEGQRRCYSCGRSLAGATVRVEVAPPRAAPDGEGTAAWVDESRGPLDGEQRPVDAEQPPARD